MTEVEKLRNENFDLSKKIDDKLANMDSLTLLAGLGNGGG